MFDTPPSNLPVEPKGPMPVPPLQPPSPAPSQTVSTTGRKEPEDIFSGMDQSGGANSANPLPADIYSTPRKSPMKMIVVITSIVLLLIAIGGILYYVFVMRPAQQAAETPVVPQTSTTQQPFTGTPVVEQPPVVDQQPTPSAQPVVEPPAGSGIPLPTPTPTLTPTTSDEVVTSTNQVTTPEPTAPTSLGAAAVEGADGDHDTLSDSEEAIFGTSPTKSDTDGDGFSDGAEVRGLFNPTQKGAGITSSLMIKIAKWNGASFLMPTVWDLVPNNENADNATISTHTAQVFTLRVVQNLSHQNLIDWVSAQVHVSGLKSYKTKNGLDAVQTPDGFTTYVALGETVWVIGYDVSNSATIDFRTIFELMTTSLRAASK